MCVAGARDGHAAPAAAPGPAAPAAAGAALKEGRSSL